MSELVFQDPLISHVPTVKDQTTDTWLVDQIRHYRLEGSPCAVRLEKSPFRRHFVNRVGRQAL